MKRVLSIAVAFVLVLSLASCTTKPKTPSYKIGIITGTASQSEEAFYAAVAMQERYPDIVVTATYPDDFANEVEATVSKCLSLASDKDIKAIVFVQAVPGAAAAMEKVKEVRPDMLFVAGVPAEDPGVIAERADIVLQADELGMGAAVVEQAAMLGAKTFVHYSFARHMSNPVFSARRDLIKENCGKLGIAFVDATVPDPTSDAGVAGAQQFIFEDVPRMVAQYGNDTAFFSTECTVQEALIRSVLSEGALFPQQCCPSPYHGYPGALGIKIPEGKKVDVDYLLGEIKNKISASGGDGRFSTWGVSVNMMFVEAGVEYAKACLDGETTGENDQEKLFEIIKQLDGECKIATYDQDGVKHENFYMVLGPFYNF